MLNFSRACRTVVRLQSSNLASCTDETPSVTYFRYNQSLLWSVSLFFLGRGASEPNRSRRSSSLLHAAASRVIRSREKQEVEQNLWLFFGLPRPPTSISRPQLAQFFFSGSLPWHSFGPRLGMPCLFKRRCARRGEHPSSAAISGPLFFSTSYHWR